jgi:hypothetical protein
MSKSQGKETGSRTTRREFAKSLALVAAAPLIGAPEANGGEDEKSSKDKLPDGVSEALTQIVRSRYGKYLTEEQVKEVKKSLEGRQRTAETMKKVKLANGDEPAFIFFADVT